MNRKCSIQIIPFKGIGLSLVFFLSILSCSNDKTSISEENTIIKKGRVGPVAVGADIDGLQLDSLGWSISEQYRADSRDVIEQVEFVIDDNEETLLELMRVYDENTGDYTSEIGAIAMTTSKFKTENGITVGATLRSILNRGVDVDAFYSKISDAFWLHINGLDGVSFILDQEAYIGNKSLLGENNIDMLDLSDFKPNAKVIKIMVY